LVFEKGFTMNFDALGLRAELMRAVSEQGYTQATPIQQQAIPVILEGRDVMASARTGTGKTAAFVLPILQQLSQQPVQKAPRALVLTPTRELAAQVTENLNAYARHLQIRALPVFGGVNINPQITRMARGIDVLIATPGRLIDHMQRGTVRLDAIQMLILDEADRMLDMGFQPAIERIVKALPKSRQTLMFSATFSKAVTDMAQRYQNNPVRIETAPANTTVAAIDQQAYAVDQSRKRELLSWLIGSNNWKQVLVFTRTKHGANRLAKQLAEDGLPSTAIHGNKTQAARTKALKDFKNQRVRVLVATDIAARGLDIDQLPQVVNFDIPTVPEDYVHRIGRTGRAGHDGLAVSLVAPAENQQFRQIKGLINQDITVTRLSDYATTESEAAPSRKPVKHGRGNGQGRSQGRGQSQGRNGGQKAGHAGRNKPRRRAA
jgi:ATP-dependent RNA helicase RhlE